MQKTRKLITTALIATLTLATSYSQGQSETWRDKLKARRAAAQSGQASADGASVVITSDGQERSFLVHVPANVKDNPGVVLVFHGGSVGTAEQLQATIGMDALADRDGFITVYPSTLGKNWTDGRIGTQGGPNDVQFTRDLVAYLHKTYGVSTDKIFATGMSNGGIFDYKLACDAPGLVQAIAPVAANMAEQLRADCHPGRGTPVMIFTGTADPLMPYDGGHPDLAAVLERVKGPSSDVIVSSADTAAFWADLNGCGGSTSTNLPDKVSDGTTVTETSFSGCDQGGVVLFSINEGGHAWPGTGKSGRKLTGKNSNDISANEEMVAFFKQYGL
jgi:polyhydroxybutyrate depolymerase